MKAEQNEILRGLKRINESFNDVQVAVAKLKERIADLDASVKKRVNTFDSKLETAVKYFVKASDAMSVVSTDLLESVKNKK